MKIYLVSAGAGVLVGEQVIPLGKAMWDGHALAAAWRHVKSDAHIFGMLPGRSTVGPIDGLKNPEKQT